MPLVAILVNEIITVNKTGLKHLESDKNKAYSQTT